MMKIFPKRFLSLYRCNSGSILIIAVWVLVFFSILSVGIHNIISARIRLVRSLEDRALSACLAKSAVTYARTERELDQTTEYDTLYELSPPVEKELGGVKFIYTLADESGKININSASAEIISRLSGVAEDIAGNISESDLKPFLVKEQLLLVDGVTEDIFQSIKEFITTYTSGGININTASLDVLGALGLDEYMLEAVDTFRKGADFLEGTEDDGIFTSADTIVNMLDLTELQKEFFSQLIDQGVIGVISEGYSLKIETWNVNRQMMRYDIVIMGDKIKEWQEY